MVPSSLKHQSSARTEQKNSWPLGPFPSPELHWLRHLKRTPVRIERLAFVTGDFIFGHVVLPHHFLFRFRLVRVKTGPVHIKSLEAALAEDPHRLDDGFVGVQHVGQMLFPRVLLFVDDVAGPGIEREDEVLELEIRSDEAHEVGPLGLPGRAGLGPIFDFLRHELQVEGTDMSDQRSLSTEEGKGSCR